MLRQSTRQRSLLVFIVLRQLAAEGREPLEALAYLGAIGGILATDVPVPAYERASLDLLLRRLLDDVHFLLMMSEGRR